MTVRNCSREYEECLPPCSLTGDALQVSPFVHLCPVLLVLDALLRKAPL